MLDAVLYAVLSRWILYISTILLTALLVGLAFICRFSFAWVAESWSQQSFALSAYCFPFLFIVFAVLFSLAFQGVDKRAHQAFNFLSNFLVWECPTMTNRLSLWHLAATQKGV